MQDLKQGIICTVTAPRRNHNKNRVSKQYKNWDASWKQKIKKGNKTKERLAALSKADTAFRRAKAIIPYLGNQAWVQFVFFLRRSLGSFQHFSHFCDFLPSVLRP